MGCDTIGKIQGHIEPVYILNYLMKNIDKNAKAKIRKIDYGPLADYVMETYDNSNRMMNWSGFIDFKYNGKNRNLFYSYSNYNAYENLEYYKPLGLEPMVKEEKTHISLGCDDDAQKIIKDIITFFGGWFDANDCDDEEFIFINKQSKQMEPIRHVTMQDIYYQFGELVIIDDI